MSSARIHASAGEPAQSLIQNAALLAHVRRAGRQRGAHDRIIAATTRATDRVLVTDARPPC